MPPLERDAGPRRRFLRALRLKAAAEGWSAVHAARSIHARLTGSASQDPELDAFLDRWSWAPEPGGLGPEILGDLDLLHSVRKGSGSYYTADDVVDYLCEVTLLPWLLDGEALTVEGGKSISADKAVTRNLDLRAVASDHIAHADEPALRALRARLAGIRIFDPTCGAGAFLVGTLRLIRMLEERLQARLGPSEEGRPHLFGVDLDAGALEICRLRLELEQVGAHCEVGLRQADFVVSAPGGEFDVVVGNPPYLDASRTTRPDGLRTSGCPNVYAWVVEQSLRSLARGGRFGMVVPISAAAGDDYQSLRKLLLQRECWISTYSNRPAKLFEGVEQRLAIVACGRQGGPLHTTAYQHWRAPDRAGLLRRLRYTDGEIWRGRVVKLGDPTARAIFHALLAAPETLGAWSQPQGAAAVWLHDGPTYWIRALSFPPVGSDAETKRGHYRRIPAADQARADALAAILSSRVFYFWFKAVGNCRDLTRREWESFPTPQMDGHSQSELAALGRALAESLRSTARQRHRRYRSGDVTYHDYYPARASSVLQRIDALLAELYGLEADALAYLHHQPRGGGEAQGPG